MLLSSSAVSKTAKKKRQVELNFDFLEKGKIYTMTYFEDGISAGSQAMDYRKKTIHVKAGDKMTITNSTQRRFCGCIEKIKLQNQNN